MRILFICGCLQPGKDGVGDYVRTLVERCVAQGHECGMVAIRDYFVSQPVEAEELVGGKKLLSLRLPSTLPWPERVKLALDFRNRFQPDWQSFQFVCYAYQDKGIVWPVNRYLQELLAGCPLHIMFHEAWIGMDYDASFKHRVTGILQLISIRRMCSMLKPQLATTSNPAYIAAYKSTGITASLLPLFGNIPIAEPGLSQDIQDRLAETGIRPDNRNGWWLGLFFGVLYQLKPEPFLSLLKDAATKTGKQICLISLGRLGATGETVWTQLQSDYPDITFLTLGEQTAETVSKVMQAVDFGIAASHWQVIGKSGSATAMLEHGLPVIVTREDYRFRFPTPDSPSNDPLFHRCDETLESKLIAGLPKRAPHSGKEEIATHFCALLGKSN